MILTAMCLASDGKDENSVLLLEGILTSACVKRKTMYSYMGEYLVFYLAVSFT